MNPKFGQTLDSTHFLQDVKENNQYYQIAVLVETQNLSTRDPIILIETKAYRPSPNHY